MITAKEAKRQSDKAIDEIITKEVPVLLKKVEEMIEARCKVGKYNCFFQCHDYSKESVDNVMLQLNELGYEYYYSLASKILIISW